MISDEGAITIKKLTPSFLASKNHSDGMNQ
jgi:hypothetical protein